MRKSSLSLAVAMMAMGASSPFAAPAILPTRTEIGTPVEFKSRKDKAKANRRGQHAAGARRHERNRQRRQPLGNSNPFTFRARRDAFDAAVADLSKVSANPEWVRKQAMKAARRVAA